MTSLFEQTPNTPAIDDSKNYLEEYVGEGKKFKDVESLAKAKAESDAFIEQLKAEQAALRQEYFALREDYNARPALQELIDQLKTPHASSDDIHANDEVPPALKPEEIEQIVAKKLQEAELTKKQQENYNTVQAKLKERYGENYVAHLENQISTLGLSAEFANDLAKNHPQVFIKTFGLDSTPSQNTFQTPPRGSVNPPSGPTNVKRDWNYYENLRKTDYQKYWDPKTQLQMMNDKLTLGDAFGN